MADGKMSLSEAVLRGRIDAARVEALTEDDLARFNVEDGFDPNDTLRGLRPAVSPAALRARTGLTQAEMAARLTVPFDTWREWEEGRTALDAVAQALLALVAADPERALQTLDGGLHAPVPQPGPEEVDGTGSTRTLAKRGKAF